MTCAWIPEIDGEPSELFSELMKLGFHRDKVKEIYALANSEDFRQLYDGRLNDQGEPVLEDLFPESYLLIIEGNKGKLRAEDRANAESVIEEYWSARGAKTPQEERLEKQKEIANRVIANIHSQIDLLKSQDTPRSREEMEKRRQEVRRLRDLLTKNETHKAIIEYALMATKQIQTVYDGFVVPLDEGQERTFSLDLVYQLQKFVEAFGSLGDIRNAVADDPELRSKFGETAIPDMDAALIQLGRIASRLSEVRMDTAAKRLAPRLESVEYKYRRKAEQDFKKEIKGEEVDPGEYEDRLRKFIASELERNEEKIREEQLTMARDLLKEVPNDISNTEMWLDAMQHVSDEVLQVVQDIWNRKRDLVRTEVIDVERRLEPLWQALADHKGNPSDQEKLYEEMLDGNYLVGRYRAEYLKEREAMMEETRITEEDSPATAEEKRRKRRQWFRDNTEQEFTDEFWETWNYLFNEPTEEQRGIDKKIRAITDSYALDELPPEKSQEIKELYVQRGKTARSEFGKRLKELGLTSLDELVEFLPTEEYYETKQAKHESLSEEEYEAWFSANHEERSYYDESGAQVTVELPIRIWTQMIPASDYVNDRYTQGVETPKEKWFNPEYDKLLALPADNAIRAFWEEAQNVMRETDELRPTGTKLVTRLGDHDAVRLPGVRKSYLERAAGEGRFAAIREYAKDQWALQEGLEEDVTEIGVTEGPGGERRRSVPVFYTKPLSDEDQSKNVAGALVLNHYTASNYKHMSEIAPELEVIYSILRDRNVLAKKDDKWLVGRTSRLGVGKDDFEVRSTRMLREFLDANIYGERTKDTDVSRSTRKKINLLMRYVSTTLLSGNIVAGFANVNIGTMNTLLEAFGGNRFSASSWRKAQAAYGKDMPGIFTDLGKLDVESRTNQLSLLFDGLNNWRGGRVDFDRNSFWKRNVNENALYALNSMGEHYIQHVAMYAILNEIKVADADGNLIAPDGSTTTEAKKALSLNQALELKDGTIQMKEGVSKILLKDGRLMEWGDEAIYRIKREIWDINEHLHGAYSDQNRNMAQRYWMGAMLHMMRKWIRPGARRRWGGVGKLVRTWDFSGDATLRYNYQTQEAVEGYYVTLWRTLGRIVQDARHDQLTWTGRWDELTDYEKANIKKAVGELTLTVIAAGSAMVLEGLSEGADDEDEDKYWFLAYQTHRLFTELSFYWNPKETLTILRHPMPTATMMENTVKLFYQILEPGERYERGSRTGELKIWKRLEDLTPWYHQYDRLKHMDESYKYLSSFY